MNECAHCHHTMEQSATFCPNCGTPVTGAPAAKAPMLPAILAYFRKKTAEWDSSDNVLMNWLPAILSIAGLIAAWEFWDMLGGAIGICGAFYGYYSSNKLNKAAAMAIGILTAVLGLVSMLL